MMNAFDGLICRRDMAKERISENKEDLMCVCVCVCVCVCARACARAHAQSCLTLCNLMDCSLPGSYVHENWSGLPFPTSGDLLDPEIVNRNF